MESTNLDNLVNSLNSDLPLQSKKDVYLEIQTCIENQTTLPFTNEKLVSMIRKHLKENELRPEALTTWILLARHTKSLSEDLCEAVYQCTENFDKIIPLFGELLNEDLLNVESILSITDVTRNKEILDCIGKISDKVAFKVYFDFINKKLLDIIFTTKHNEIRYLLIDFVLTKTSYSIKNCSLEEQKHISNIFKNNYIKNIDVLRMQNDLAWYALCIFTMKYCGTLLHSEIDLTNMILHKVEVGFKTKTVQDRLLAYDCWKVLIDTCNLDHNYISSAKQLRLLVKPLKVKLSRNEEIVRKRFEIWFYLAKILQGKVLNCIEELLKFFFELQSTSMQSEMSIDSTIIKDTWTERIEILMAAIGHFDDDPDCLKKKNFKFEAIMVASNFLEFDNLLFNCVFVACKMISKWCSSPAKQSRIRCLWGSIFKIIQNLSENTKEGVLHKVSKVLLSILQECISITNYFEDIMVHIFSLLQSFKEPICNSLLLNEIVIFPIIRFMLSQTNVDPSWSKEVITLVWNVPKTGNKPFYFNRVCELLKTSSQINNHFSVQFWLHLGEELYNICKMPREDFNEFRRDAMFLVTWIFTKINLEEVQNIVLPTWLKAFSEISTISNTFGEDFLQNCEKLLKTRPDTAINILTVLPDVSQLLLNNKTYKRYALTLLSIMCQCLQNPYVSKKVILTIPVLRKALSYCIGGDSIETTSIILKIYECIEYILKPYEVFEVLEVLKEIVPKLSQNIKKKLPTSLKVIIKDLAMGTDSLVSQDAVLVLSQFAIEEKNELQSFVRPVSARTAKIANMAKDIQSPKGSMLKILSSEKKRNGESNRTNINVRVKRNDTKMPSGAGNIDEDSGEFMFIDKEVNIDKHKLSRHQREIMNKRNEDIPALYQDLSQSQHSIIDSCNSSNSSSQKNIDLTLNDNFNDVITDLRKKNDILQGHIDTEISDTFENKTWSFDNKGESTTFNKNVSCCISKEVNSCENILPKVDLNTKFENSLKVDKNTTKSDNRNHKEESVNEWTDKACIAEINKPVYCSSKFEEKMIKTEPAQAPVFPDCNLGNATPNCEKKLKRKLKHKPIRNRRMSDSHIVLQKTISDDTVYNCMNVNENFTEDVDRFPFKESGIIWKQFKTKTKEFKSKLHDKHKYSLNSDKASNESQKLSEGYNAVGTKRNKSLLKKKYRSLDNLNDITQGLDVKKAKKCFKIIQNNIGVSNSIKLRISITNEDNDIEPDIIEQLDTEISKIDANLQNNSSLLHKKSNLVADNSESIFGSLDDWPSNVEQSNLSILNTHNIVDNVSVNHVTETVKNIENNIGTVSSKEEEDQVSASETTQDNTQKQHYLQRRKRRELERIKMDIVGAEDFIVTTPRKRRASKLLETPAKDAQINKTTSLHLSIEKKKGKKGKATEMLSNVQQQNNSNEFKDKDNSNKVVTPKRTVKQRRLKSQRSTETVPSEAVDTSKNNITCGDVNEDKLLSIKVDGEANCGNSRLDSPTKNDITNTNIKEKLKLNKRPVREEFRTRRKNKTDETKVKASLAVNLQSKSMEAVELNDVNANSTRLNKSVSELSMLLVPVQENTTDSQLLQTENIVESSQEPQAPLVNGSLNLLEYIGPKIDIHIDYASGNLDTQELHSEDINTSSLADEDKKCMELSCEFAPYDSIIEDKVQRCNSINFKCEINGILLDETTNDSSITNCEIDVSTFSETEEIDIKKESYSDTTNEPNNTDKKTSNKIETVVSLESLTVHGDIETSNCSSTVVDVCNMESQMPDKSQVYKEEIFDQDETQTCNPYSNVENDKDFLDKLEKHGPGAARTVIRDLDFADLPLVFETPKKENIPCSPICDDTPDRDKEFMKSTLNISPIKLEFTESEISEKSLTQLTNDRIFIKKPTTRSAKLLNLLPTPTDVTSSKVLQTSKKIVQADASTPTTQRIRKMISNCQLPIEKSDDLVTDDSTIMHPLITEEYNVLKFTRELPSPLATPNSSILKKRALSEYIDDSISPHHKRRKRVNFSDPPTTSQKIYFMENEEKIEVISDTSCSMVAGLNVVKENTIYSDLTACTTDINDVITIMNRDLLKHFHSVNIKTVGDLADLNENQLNQLEFLTEPPLKRVMEALDIVYRNYSCKEKESFPICVELADCPHSIDTLFCSSDGNFKTARSKNINTVGDLAKLTKADVVQLSLKLSSVLKALQKYHRKLNKSKILAKQMQEERFEDVDDTDLGKSSGIQNKFGAGFASSLSDNGQSFNTVDTNEMTSHEVTWTKENINPRRTADEEFEHIMETYSEDEVRTIFTRLKNCLP